LAAKIIFEMKFFKIFFFIVFIIGTLKSIGQIYIDSSTFIPPDNNIENWTIVDSIKVYHVENLYLFQDSDDDLFIEYGMNELINCQFANPQSIEVQLEIYVMQDVGAAFGIYTMKNSLKGTKMDVGDEGTLYDYFLHFVKGNYYVKCTSSNNSPEFMQVITDFSKYIENKIEIIGKKPELLKAFNFDHITIKQRKYFRGQIGLSNVFSLGHGSIAAFSEGVSGRDSENLFFVFSYPDERKRREWFASAKGKMNMNKKFSELNFVEDGFTVKDKYGSFFSFKPMGKYIMVLRGYNWDEAKPVFEEMYTNLNDRQN